MIDYQLLAKAQQFYSDLGFLNIDAPWEITKAVDNLTKPSECNHIFLSDTKSNVLVASAEQSFLQMRTDGLLVDGMYQAITPCFRDDIVDATHKRMFMKLELIKISSSPLVYKDMYLVYNAALNFFTSQGINVKSITTDEAMFSVDIECAVTGIELGSYGIRYNENVGYWVYGTGVAEPRFSMVKTAQKPQKTSQNP